MDFLMKGFYKLHTDKRTG